MKKSFLLLGLIFALGVSTAHAQIQQFFSQDFETGSPVNYTVSNAASAQTQATTVSGGSRSMKLVHTQGEQIIMTLDTIDFSVDGTLNYYTLEFMHIAFVNPTLSSARTTVCYIEVKRPGETAWRQLNSTNYNMTEGGCQEFVSTGSFSNQSYMEWRQDNVPNNSMWKAERFDLEQLFQGVSVTDKKLIIRFIVNSRTAATSTDAWYIDDIRVRASSQAIVAPVIDMRLFPDALNYPSSRGAHVEGDVTTTVLQGINSDSVFIDYRVGNNPTVYRSFMTRTGVANRFSGRIPFYGYDTLIHYHVVAQDSTTNHNTTTYPKNSNQWLTFKCVRGSTNTGQMTGNQTNVSAFPFPNDADARSEYIYDSTTMASLGFKPGYINRFRFILSSSPQTVTRPRLQIRMSNVPNYYGRTSGGDNTKFNASSMQIVYDSVFVIEQAAAGSYKMVELQDTFFYAGGAILVQVFYDGNVDVSATPVKHVPVASQKLSLYTEGMHAHLHYNPFTTDISYFEYGTEANTRPWIQFFETANVPLIYDCGVSGFSYPSETTPCNVGTDSVVVWLKNYGVREINAVRMWYRIDNQPAIFYDWTGSLPGGDSVRVHLNDNQAFSVGYHTIRAWVDDTLTITHDNIRVRDHEPYNDTSFSRFASCDGPYHGERTIGTGASAHFESLEKCLYVLSRCGIDGPLTIKMPAGIYDVTTFPYIPGTSATNLVTFEPISGQASVTFRRSRNGINTNAEALVDMSEAHGIRFNNITFANGRFADNRCNVLVQLGSNSAHCHFENCTFVDSNMINNSARALIHTGYSDSVTIVNNTFYGGTIGIDVRGAAPDILSVGNVVQYNNLSHQVNTAISVVNQSNVLIDSNFANDVQTNASYIVLGQYVYGSSRITRNKVFSSKGSCCIGVSDMHGSASGYGVVANNMVVSLFDGSTNMLTTPLNIIKGSYLKVVFNSVRMNSPQFVNVAAATLGSDVISNIYFQNNVIASFDSTNYAFNFMPGDNPTNLHVDHNCYYSASGVLNKITGVNYHNINAWRSALPSDVGSVNGNPNYTNGSVSRVDLRSFNALLRNVGVPVPEVTDDIFGTTRNATAPSLGAYEVTALSIDFTPVEFVSPEPDYCGAPASIPVEVAIRNTGNGTYTYSSSTPIYIYYSIDNGPVQSFTVNRDCGPMDTIHFLSTRTMALPSGANNTDRTYSIKWWVKCSLDPDDLNDTSVYTVLSRYAAPAPTPINISVPYNTAATITPTLGIVSWPVNYYTTGTARQQRSGISWYHSMDDPDKFYYGPTLVTTPLYDDTTFFISQKRNLPLVKITEVQVNKAYPGVTTPMPSWMHAQTNFAIELTNIGDYPANLEGDSVLVIQSNQAAKVWVLPNVTIQPGACLMLQFKTNNDPSDSTRTIYAPSSAQVTPAYTANFAVVYRDGHGVADAVPFNAVITTPSTQAISWSNQNIPASVWQGNAIDLAKGASTATPPVNTPTAGARRIAWPTNSPTSSPTPTATLWQVATANTPMQVGTVEENLIRYFDNGCEGARSQVTISVTNVPVNDLAVDYPVVDTGCNLSTAEPVSVLVHNYGSSPVAPVVLHYSLDGGATIACTDTIASGIGTRSSVYHTFSSTLNMHLSHDTTFHVKVWVDAVTSDISHSNDTNEGYYYSAYTPEPPVVVSPRTVNYGDTLHLEALGLPSNSRVAWYDAHHVALDTTTGVFATPYIYHPDTFFVKSIALRNVPSTHVGNLTAVANNNYPSPYNPKTRYVKEQYIYTADQIIAAGHQAGEIGSISFYLESLGNNVNSFTFDYYTIKIGPTTASTFTGSGSNIPFLTGLTQVYSASNLTLSAQNIGWVQHDFDTPYQWDGTSNIVVEVTRALSTAGISAGANTRYTAQANTVVTKQNASTDQAAQPTGARGGNRPDIIFGFLEPVGCESAESAVHIQVTGIPAVDASITWPDGMDTVVYTSCDSNAFTVKLSNLGSNNINEYILRYKIDNNAWAQTTGNANNLPLSYYRIVPLCQVPLTPGRHTITAVINVAGDSVPTNDTIVRTVNVRFCGGEYIVGSCLGSQYPNLTTLMDTIQHSGVAGAVTFRLCEEVFNEQITLGPIVGTSPTNTVRFTTEAGATTYAKITHNPTNASNYVFAIEGASYVTFDSLYFYANYTTGTGNSIYANVLRIGGSQRINIHDCEIRSKASTASSTNANVILLGDANSYITINNCIIDSGYYGVRSFNNNLSDNITISNNKILHFWYQGVHLRNTDTVSISRDSIASGVAINAKPLTGIYVANSIQASIQRNFVTLTDQRTGGKRGIVVSNCRGTNIDRVTLYNNMITVYGTAAASLVSTGIYIDSLCRNVNVYYNTAAVYAGPTQPNTMAFSCQRSSNIHVLNNIFDNRSQGYAYYVAIDTCIASSNFNVYYSNAVPHPTTGARKFAKWGANEPVCLDSLRAINGKETNSIEEYPYYVYYPTNLKLKLAQFSDKAQYNPDVITDVFGITRPQIPTPTIGAHEFIRCSHDVSVAELLSPVMPAITTGNNPEVLNIETDSILVHVRFYNNGESPETNVTWSAYFANVSPTISSEVRTIRNMPIGRLIEDSVKVPSPLGILDTHYMVVECNLSTASSDCDMINNFDTAQFFIYPAYDLQLVSVAVDSTVDEKHCRMYQVPLRYTLKNAGKKDFPGDFAFTLGYDYYCHQPSTQSFPNFPGSDNTDVHTFGSGNDLPVGTNRDVLLSVPNQPNLYPTGYIGDITVRLRGFVHHEFDVKYHNDTTNYINITSNHTPEMPIAHDTMVDYGTYGNLYATQNANRTIRWHRDTTSGDFFYNGNNNYNRSTHWSETPQYFHDSTYYLACLSTRNCTSYYAPINVGINPPLYYDVSISEVRSPRASGRVYLEKDTVTLRVVNYGSQAISNIPIAFKFMNANGRVTYLEVHDTVRTTIPGRVGDNVSYYDFTFDTALLQNTASALVQTQYTLNAWVYHPDDQQRGNDTLRHIHNFKALPESVYDNLFTDNNWYITATEGFDIKHVSFNEIDNQMPDMIGYDNLWLGSYNAAQAEVPTLFVRRGTQDTITIEVANNQNEMDSSTAASLFVAIDYNRDGFYDFVNEENINPQPSLLGKGYKVRSRRPISIPYTVPEYAHYGYQRMIVWVEGDSTAFMDYPTNATHANGQIQQYLLYVQEDVELDSVDAALTRVAAPRNPIVTENNHYVTVMLANKGATPLTSATIEYAFNDNYHPAQSGTINWTGNLDPGKSVPVRLDSIDFYEGTTDLLCTVSVPGDTFHTANNELHYRFHRYFVVEATVADSFDVGINKWYVPAGYNNYTRNYFERGIPAKSHIVSAYSQPNALITSTTESVVTGVHGNRSVVYSPIINIQQIKVDTIKFLISKDMAEGAFMWMEYLNYEKKWVLLDHPSARWGAEDNPSWYDQQEGWTGSTNNGEYIPVSIPTTGTSGNFPQRLQFRFIFTTPVTTSSSASFGDGAAIDNLVIGRARRDYDVGVVDITYPVHPQFGQTIHPRILIHNYGLKAVSDIPVSYRPYGTYLAREAVCPDTVPIDGDIEFEFPDPFIITNAFPDTFDITAFTRMQHDIYYDNDSTTKTFTLSPLQNDLQLSSIVSPLRSVVAGDSMYITVRMRNFGQNEINAIDMVYSYNAGAPVREHVDFNTYLGHPLGSGEYFNYTFRHRERSTMGTMELTTWGEYAQDVYPYNDTLSMLISGVSAITDVEVEGAFVDIRYTDHDPNDTLYWQNVGIAVKNIGARMVNNFTIGFWYDNDTSNRMEQTFYRENGLASGERAVHYVTRAVRQRSAPYDYITSYVSVPNDTNQSNDTSFTILPLTTELGIIKLQVEENRTDSCRIRAVLTNTANLPYNNNINLEAVINGSDPIKTSRPRYDRYIEPGQTIHLDFINNQGNYRKIPKSPTRTYQGTGLLRPPSPDANPANDQTTIIEVVNYFEDVPMVQDFKFGLEQNYPNPFDGSTRIEFVIPSSGQVRFFVNDVVGRQVYESTSLYSGGRNTISFNKGNLSSGVYYYGIEYNGQRRLRKMILK